MPHYLIVGMTESGKSTLAKLLAKQWKKSGLPIAVLDPLAYPDWPCDFHTSRPENFLRHLKTHKEKAWAIIDEGGVAIGRYNEAMNWCFTTSRHIGWNVLVITQGVTQLPPIVRGQCSGVFLFQCANTNWQILAEEFNRPELVSLSRLGKGEFLFIPRFGEILKGRVDFAKRRLYYDKLSQ
jgi:hypothetical protein